MELKNKITITILIFLLGFISAYSYATIEYYDRLQKVKDNKIMGGAWIETDDYNFICIDVQNRTIEDIERAIWHEIMHNEFYNLNEGNLSGTTREQNEKFAVFCASNLNKCLNKTERLKYFNEYINVSK